MGDEEAKPYSWLSLEPLQEGQVRYKAKILLDFERLLFHLTNPLLILILSLLLFLPFYSNRKKPLQVILSNRQVEPK